MMPASDPLAAIADWGGRPSIAVIDLDQLDLNLRVLRDRLSGGTKLMAVVKADGYGHGAVPVGKAAMRGGADELAVATVEEGVRLRQAGVTAPILVMGPIGARERPRAIANDLMLVAADAGFVRGLVDDARTAHRKEPVAVHLKIDTGMHRFGTSPREAVELATAIHSAPELRLAGVMTHFASADDPDPAYSRMQAETFDIACNAISATGIDIPSEHLCNSAAALAYPEYHRDRVRVGIAMYGLRPDPELLPVPEPMRPIMTIHSRLARVLDIEPGDRVSYGGSWKAESATRIGLVPIGYADGYRRQGSNRAWMDVNGSRAPVRGRVCMDQTMAEVGDNARQGDPVTVIGDGATSCAPTIDELAVLYGSISHEVATSYAIQRLAHLYVRDGALVAVSDLWGCRELDEDAFAQPELAEMPAAVT